MKRFQRVILDDLLPTGSALVCDTKLEIVTLVRGSAFIEQVHLPPKEFEFLMAVCEAHPRACSYEQLIAVKNQISVEEAAVRLLSALEASKKRESDVFDKLMRPVRNLMSRLRDSIMPFGLSISSGEDGEYKLKSLEDGIYTRLKAKLELMDDMKFA